MIVTILRRELLTNYKVTDLMVDILIRKHATIINQAKDAKTAIEQIVALENIGRKGTADGADSNPPV